MNNFIINSLVVVKATSEITTVKVIMGAIYLCANKKRYNDNELRYATSEEEKAHKRIEWWK